MMKALKTWFGSIGTLLTSPIALAIFASLYAVLLASSYWFVATREATVWQVALTIIFLVLIPVEFFVLQSSILTYANDRRFAWGTIARNALKLALVTLPIVLVGLILWHYLNKWQARYPTPEPPVIQIAVTPGKAPPAAPVHWPTLLFATLRGLVFGIALPLATITLWIEFVGGGAKSILGRIRGALARAFDSESVLTYGLGLIVFVLIPYAVLFRPVRVSGTKTDFAVFIFRLLLVFVFTLIGWTVTLLALSRLAEPTPAAAPANEIHAEAEAAA